VRTLVVTSLFPNRFDPGRAGFNGHQVAALACQHHVRVIAPVAWTDELRGRLARRCAPPPPHDVMNGDVWHPRYYFTPRVMRSWHGHAYYWSVRRAFRRAVRDFQPAVVYGTWAYPDGWAAVKLARSVGLPVVVKVHGCDVLCGGRGLASDPVRLRRTRECLGEADAVVAVSRHLASAVAALGVDERRIHTIYNGVDATVFHPGPRAAARAALCLPADERTVVFVGRLDPVKGLETLLTACGTLAARGKRFSCHVVGDGPLRAALLRRVAELGLAGIVKLHGACPQRELGDWYRAADVVVAPSDSEGVPNVLLEAIACGAPFIATRVGGIPEIADEANAVLIPPADAVALADALEARFAARASGVEPVAPITPRSHDAAARELAQLFEHVIAAGAAATAPRPWTRAETGACILPVASQS
jgi:glycosyltransferase involved in cell wall biosynthesis